METGVVTWANAPKDLRLIKIGRTSRPILINLSDLFQGWFHSQD